MRQATIAMRIGGRTIFESDIVMLLAHQALSGRAWLGLPRPGSAVEVCVSLPGGSALWFFVDVPEEDCAQC